MLARPGGVRRGALEAPNSVGPSGVGRTRWGQIPAPAGRRTGHRPGSGQRLHQALHQEGSGQGHPGPCGADRLLPDAQRLCRKVAAYHRILVLFILVLSAGQGGLFGGHRARPGAWIFPRRSRRTFGSCRDRRHMRAGERREDRCGGRLQIHRAAVSGFRRGAVLRRSARWHRCGHCHRPVQRTRNRPTCHRAHMGPTAF